MRMSCNGCRVLRKGCSEDCTIRPCLQWIKNPEAQGNATLFLAKFYGRAGLLNLIAAGPDHLRPAIFRSLLYESCGRIVNPIYGSVGLLWSGNWHMCQAAVEAVLKGAPVIQIPSETAAATTPAAALKAFDIRHVPKDDGTDKATGFDLHKVAKTTRTRFKRSSNGGARINSAAVDVKPSVTPIEELQKRPRARSPDSSASPPKPTTPEHESMFSMETIDASTVTSKGHHADNDDNVELQLTLGHSQSPSPTDTTTITNTSSISPACSGSRRDPSTTGRCDTATGGASSAKYKIDLGLHLRA